MTELGLLLGSRGARLTLKIAGVLAAVAVLGGAAWLWLRAEDARGQVALAAATELVHQADGPQATGEARQRAIASLQTLLAQHGRSSAAVEAAYQLGNLQYQAGDYAAARGAYDTYLRANRIEEGVANYNVVVRLMLGTTLGPDSLPQLK